MDRSLIATYSFQPNTTYISTPAYPGLPANPLPSSASLPPDPTGQSIRTTPFFATGKTGASDYDPSVSNNNIRTIQIPMVPGRATACGYTMAAFWTSTTPATFQLSGRTTAW